MITKSSGRFLGAADTACLAECLTTRIFENVARMCRSNILYGQADTDRLSNRKTSPSMTFYTGLPNLAIPEEQRYVRPCIGTILKGSLNAMIGPALYTAREGDWLFCPPGISHRVFRLNSGVSYQMLWFVLHPQVELVETRYSLDEDFYFTIYRTCRQLPAEIQRDGERILTHPGQSLDELRYRMMRIVTWWLDVLMASANEITVHYHPLVARVLVLLDQSEPRSLSVKHLASNLGVSAGHLSRVFHQSMGQTICQAIQCARIEQAKRHLANPALSIKEIAFMVGFASSQHLARAFQRLTGFSPTAFRENHQPHKK